jgi:hypothetical protein
MQSQIFAQGLSLGRFAAKASACIAAVTLSFNAAAAPQTFTFDPSAVGLNGAAFSGDNLLISDFATITSTPTGFTQSGYLSITSAQLGSAPAGASGGLNSTYGLYVAFSASGDITTPPAPGPFSFYSGELTNVSYTLYGYNGSASFSPSTVSLTDPGSRVTLATGSLESGGFTGLLAGGQVAFASSFMDVTFTPEAGAAGFFGWQGPFSGLAQATFVNASSTITNTATGFTVSQGGGTISFIAAPVPEPETYAMLVVGLGLIATVVGRRSRRGMTH